MMKLIILSLFCIWSVAQKNRITATRPDELSFEEIQPNNDTIEASGDAKQDIEKTDSNSEVTLGPHGRVMVKMPPPEEDWVNDLQTGFLNIFGNAKIIGLNTFLCTLFLVFLI